MGCKDCDKAQESNSVYYYRWKNANIEVSGCKNHIKEIFNNLNKIQEVKMAEDEQSEEDSATPEEVVDEDEKSEETKSEIKEE